ncbi:hypothetical protein HYZ97_01770 [Candidatus Pacearchaeota archaeon]|nr:hypothetical protein [Candidatus Pacearchaeota archaeon]
MKVLSLMSRTLKPCLLRQGVLEHPKHECLSQTTHFSAWWHIVFWIFLLIIFTASIAAAQQSFLSPYSSASFVTRQTSAPSFQTYYSSEGRLGTYWPILNDPSQCEARQDILLQVAPGGCQPAVVRSDLLAEQNVPVFCQIDALKINPLLDIKEIRSIRFRGQYPKEVVGTGFHPARAALRTRDRLLGDPLLNNIGYVVVVVRKTPNETALPESLEVNLQAQIHYESGNALGIGRADFFLSEQSDAEWEQDKERQSFWNGKYSVRLEAIESTSLPSGAGFSSNSATGNSVVVSVYSGDRKVGTTRIARGETSRDIYVPGSYCQAAVSVQFVGFQKAAPSARLEIGNGNSTDLLDVYRGSRFLDGKCEVLDIQIDNLTRTTGKVSVRCPSGRLDLSLQQRGIGTFDVFKRTGASLTPSLVDGVYVIDYGTTHAQYKGKYGLTTANQLVLYDVQGNTQIANTKTTGMQQEFLDAVRLGLGEYKLQHEIDSGAEPSVLQEKIYGEPTDSNVSAAVNTYESLVQEYPSERASGAEDTFGAQGLIRAITFARETGKEGTRARLLQTFIETYPDAPETPSFTRELATLYKRDSSQASSIVELDDRYRTIRLVSLHDPIQTASAQFSYGAETIELQHRHQYQLSSAPLARATNQQPYLELIDYDIEHVLLRTNCNDIERSVSTSGTIRLNLGDSVQICGKPLVLKRVDAEQVAHIRLVPKARATESEANVTVRIGIEKRNIALSPEKAQERVANLNKSIEKWESLSKNLNGVVSGLQGACFATSAVLTAKNFISGLSGEALARQQVMPHWKNYCREAVANGTYVSPDACFLDKSSEIEADVGRRTEDIKSANTEIALAQQNAIVDSSILTGTSIDSKAAAKNLAKEVIRKYGDVQVHMPQGEQWRAPGTSVGSDTVKVKDLLSDDAINRDLISYEEIRQLYTNLEGQTGYSSVMQKGITDSLGTSAQRIRDNLQDDYTYKSAQNALSNGIPAVSYPEQFKGGTLATVSLKSTLSTTKNVNEGALVSAGKSFVQEYANAEYISLIQIGRPSVSAKETGIAPLAPGMYLAGLRKIDTTGYEIVQAYKVNEIKENKIVLSNERANLGQYTGIVTSTEQISYQNPLKKPEVRYYDTEPYKGMPAIVPFDTRNGWYAATRQTLPVFGGIGAFDASGRITSFSLCNAGKNGLVDFEIGYGDDICRQFVLNIGQPLNKFPGLSDAQAQRLVDKAISALEEASRQYQDRNAFVSIAGNRIPLGKPALNRPETQCQDFMSPSDCHILFNVCDPVICPATRCDFGGKYPVANVIDTGIIGSTLLCLPNIKEQIYVPVCLSGIQAGIDGYVSVLKAHRDCLQESVSTGQMVGICDQIYSVYSCEFFWRQLSPLSKVLVPKLFEIAQGQGTRGGGEYLTVAGAWANTRKSIDYFTQSYGVNTFKAFQARSVEEAGGEFCKGFVSAKAPTSFKSLTDPISPPQFHAYFSSTKFTDATVPATAQYKVFYHIFSGKDASVFYRVYLKNPPASSYYAATPIIQVATGYIGRGQYKTETKDFTAPEGYQELCVNVNGDEKCGFKQVTTSFALNYVRDEFVKDQITEQGITSEEQCISGSTNAAALLNPGLQQGAEEAVNPEIYRRGIIRICSTANPGSSTDPTRFVDVGFCSDTKVRCWLDKKSVDNAITDNNRGIRNETLQTLTTIQKENLVRDGTVLDDADAQTALNDVSGSVKDLASSGVIKDRVKAATLSKRIDNLFSLLYFNHQKAELTFLKAQLREGIARGVLAEQAGVTQPTQPGSSTTSSADAWSVTSALEEVERRISYAQTSAAENRELYLELQKAGVLNLGEYNDLSGDGFFNREKDILELRKILLVKQQLAASSTTSDTPKTSSPQTSQGSGQPLFLLKDVYQPKTNGILIYDFKTEEYTNFFITQDKVYYLEVEEAIGGVVTDSGAGDIRIILYPAFRSESVLDVNIFDLLNNAFILKDSEGNYSLVAREKNQEVNTLPSSGTTTLVKDIVAPTGLAEMHLLGLHYDGGLINDYFVFKWNGDHIEVKMNFGFGKSSNFLRDPNDMPAFKDGKGINAEEKEEVLHIMNSASLDEVVINLASLSSNKDHKDYWRIYFPTTEDANSVKSGNQLFDALTVREIRDKLGLSSTVSSSTESQDINGA